MSPPDADTSAGLSEVDLERSLKGERATSLSFPAGRPEPGTSSRASRVSPADPTPDSAPFPPASGVGDKAASSYAVPIVDLSNPDETAVADALWDAATTVGFFTVVGHGIDEESIDAQFEASREFFEQDLAVKEAASPFEPALNSGFEHMKQVRPSTGLPDVKESLQVTARADAMSGRWPPKPADFEARTRAFMTKSHALAARILTLLEPRACPGQARGTLADAHTLWGPDGQCTLRHLHYPPMSAERVAALPPGSWRAGAHTDWCCVTLLFQRTGEFGLECAANPRTNSTEWAPVDPVPGGVAVNVGDMLSRWSDGRLLSNLHRVRMPAPKPETGEVPVRYSLAFFMQADKSAMIQCAEQPPITAGDYILGRIRSNFEK